MNLLLTINLNLDMKRIKLNVTFNIFLCFLFFYFTYFAEAQNIKKEQRNIGNWIAYIEQNGNKKVCYTYSNPVQTRLYEGERKSPYFNINYFDGKGMTITVYTGYEMTAKYPVTINIENKDVNLNNIFRDYAVTYDSSQDMYLINLFIKTNEDHFFVKSYKDKDNVALDYYSLSGLKEALKYLKNKCS